MYESKEGSGYRALFLFQLEMTDQSTEEEQLMSVQGNQFFLKKNIFMDSKVKEKAFENNVRFTVHSLSIMHHRPPFTPLVSCSNTKTSRYNACKMCFTTLLFCNIHRGKACVGLIEN